MQYSKHIEHHGVIGQKWGVRRGPPYPIEDTVLKKGTKLNSVSPLQDSKQLLSSGKWLYTYNPEDTWDSKVYKGPFSVYKIQSGARFVFEHSFEVVEDLKMPTRKQRVDEFIDLYKKNKFVAKDLKEIQSRMRLYGVGSEGSRNVKLKKLKTTEDFNDAYELFGHAMENVSRFKSTKAYAKIMSQKYDAMVDDNNQGVYNNAHDPIIIFRANKALKAIGEVKLVDYETIRDNYIAVANELEKEGKPVLL